MSLTFFQIFIQASSPDEIALVKWTEQMGLTLIYRDLYSMRLKLPTNQVSTFNILQIFPFTSESKRMGIIVRVKIVPLGFNFFIFTIKWILIKINFIIERRNGRDNVLFKRR